MTLRAITILAAAVTAVGFAPPLAAAESDGLWVGAMESMPGNLGTCPFGPELSLRVDGARFSGSGKWPGGTAESRGDITGGVVMTGWFANDLGMAEINGGLIAGKWQGTIIQSGCEWTFVLRKI